MTDVMENKTPIYNDKIASYIDGFDEAIIGLTWDSGDNIVVYDKGKMIDILCRDKKMSRPESESYFYYNIQTIKFGNDRTPIYVDRFNRKEIDDIAEYYQGTKPFPKD